MYFYFGWFILICDTYEDEIDVLHALVLDLKSYLAAIPAGLGILDVENVNGKWVMTLKGGFNRRPGQWQTLKDVLNYVSKNLPGSYGVLYEETEDPLLAPFPGSFSVIVMRRGHWHVEKDSLLSPIVPTILDPEKSYMVHESAHKAPDIQCARIKAEP